MTKCQRQVCSAIWKQAKKGNSSRARSPHCTQEQQKNPLLHQICSKPGKSGQTGKIPAGVMKKHLTLAKASVPHQLMCVLCDSSTTEFLWEFPTCTRLHNTKRRASKLLTSDLRLERTQMLQRLGKSAQNSFRGGWGALKSEQIKLDKTLDSHTFPPGCSYEDYARHHNNFPNSQLPWGH